MLYDGQNNVRIRLTGLGNITGNTSALIKYIKPDKTSGSWIASIENITTGIIYYDMLPSEELTAGFWYFWPYIVFSDTRVSIGDAVKYDVLPEGEIIP